MILANAGAGDPVLGRYQFTLEAKGDDVLTVEVFLDITFSVSEILSG